MYCDAGEQGIPDEWRAKITKSGQIAWLSLRLFKVPAKSQVPCPETIGSNEGSDINKGKLLEMVIEELDFAARTFSCLHDHGVRTVLDLTMMTLDDYSNIRGLGRKRLEEIENKLAMMGLHIAEE